jgi:uncharacterized protein
VNSSSAQHPTAKKYLEAVLSGSELVGFPWETLNAFMRISTNHRIWQAPLSAAEAAGYVDEWLSRDSVRIVTARENHWEEFRKLVQDFGLKSDLVMDGHLATYAITYDAELVSTDADFQRFRNVRLINPCSPSA